MKVAVVAAAGTTRLAGTWAAAVLLLVRVTVVPPVGASALNVTVPCELAPPTTLAGFSVRELTLTCGVTDKEAFCELPLKVAVIVELAVVVTAPAVIVNVALVALAATTTVEGTCAAAVLELVRLTVAPPVGAGPLSVTVPCELAPPTTTVGFSVTEDTNTPFEIATPTVVVGSVAAYCRSRKFVTEETVFPQASSPNVPVEKLASVALITDVPLIQNECDVPLIAAFTAYDTPRLNAPPLPMETELPDFLP